MKASDLIGLFRTIDNLARLDARVTESIGTFRQELAALNARVTRREAREDIVAAEARGAAAAAASVMLADVARRVGILEARSNLLPPAAI